MAVLRRDQLHDRTLPCVLRGCHQALGLIHHQHHPTAAAQPDAVTGHRLGLGIDLPAAVPFRAAIHLHPASLQDQLHLAAGAHTAVA